MRNTDGQDMTWEFNYKGVLIGATHYLNASFAGDYTDRRWSLVGDP